MDWMDTEYRLVIKGDYVISENKRVEDRVKEMMERYGVGHLYRDRVGEVGERVSRVVASKTTAYNKRVALEYLEQVKEEEAGGGK